MNRIAQTLHWARMKLVLLLLGKKGLIANVNFYGTVYLDHDDPIDIHKCKVYGFNKSRLGPTGAAFQLGYFAKEYEEWNKTNEPVIRSTIDPMEYRRD